MTKYLYDCHVRWSDQDVFGHVNNARVLTLLEEARVALFFLGAREAGLTSFESGIVIIRHEIDYLRPIDYRSKVRIEMWISELRRVRLTVAYELFSDDVLAARAASVCTRYDLAQQHPRRLSDEEREFLARWQA